MQIIKVRFLKEDKPAGKCYTYFSPVIVKTGDIVQVNGSTKGVVVEVDVPEWEVEPYREKIKSIVGLAEEKPTETFDPAAATLTQANYCREHNYPHFAPKSGNCYSCNQNIYAEGKRRNGNPSKGISVEMAGRELITGCPHCNWSFCE